MSNYCGCKEKTGESVILQTVARFSEKVLTSHGRNTTPDRKQYPMLMLSCINTSEFGVSPLKPDAAGTVLRMAAEIQSRKTQKAPPAPLQATLRPRCCGWKNCQRQLCSLLQTYCSFMNVSGPATTPIQQETGQRPPRGNIYQLLHAGPLAQTLDLLPWHIPFTLNLLRLTVCGIAFYRYIYIDIYCTELKVKDCPVI